MAKPELGTKRLCDGCAAKFYDLNKDPIFCPKCGTQFVLVAEKVEPEPAPAPEPEEDNDETNDDAPEIISLEDADAEVAGEDEDLPDLGDDEVESDIGDNDDDTFLDTEDEDDPGVTDIVGAPATKEVE